MSIPFFKRLSALVFIAQIMPSLEHARLMEPPSRASMWRLGFPTPVDQDDNQAYCGGYGIQHGQYGGRCGICGDAWGAIPRAHEAPGGIYATGIIGKSYRQGSYIPIIVDITANHQGYIEFKICANNDIFMDPDQSCFESRHPLWVGGGDPLANHRRYPVYDYETGLRLIYAKLPLDLTCKQCIIQFTYVAGNNWGKCDDGSGAVGCGPQETFRGCADVEIVSHPLLSSVRSDSIDDTQRGNDKELFFDEVLIEKGINDGHLHSVEEDEIVDVAQSLIDEEDLMELRRKKTLLERVMARLRELITASQQTGENEIYDENEYHDEDVKAPGWKYWNTQGAGDSVRQETNAKVYHSSPTYINQSPRKNSFSSIFEVQGGAGDRSWERIKSNRH